MPKDDDARRQWLGAQVRARLARRAEQFRQLCLRCYGPTRGNAIQYAEAFEACEYGAPLDETARQRLFPFVHE